MPLATSLPSEEALNREWLEQDAELLREVFPLFALPFSFGEYKAAYGFQDSSSFDNAKPLGLGYRIEHLSRYGGYTSIRCVLIVDGENRVCRGRIDLDSDARVLSALRGLFPLHAYFKDKLDTGATKELSSYAFTDDKTYRNF